MGPHNDSSEETVPAIESLDDLVAELRKVFESDNINVEYVNSLMEAYKSDTDDWKKFAKFEADRYTRNLVDEGNGKYNLIIVAWGEGHASVVHDHADSHCFMRIINGTLREVRYEWPEEGKGENDALKLKSVELLKPDEVCYINDSLGLHKLENAVEQAVSLHLYSPPINTCHMFDKSTGHRTKCQVTFWSKYGQEEIHGTSSNPATADVPRTAN